MLYVHVLSYTHPKQNKLALLQKEASNPLVSRKIILQSFYSLNYYNELNYAKS